jgi:hypothetical protein
MICALLLSNCGNFDDSSHPGKPGTETPGNETPGTETPGNETPGNETPGNETPGNETPGNETPGNETPGNETPGNETPGNETPGTALSGIEPEDRPKITINELLSIIINNSNLITADQFIEFNHNPGKPHGTMLTLEIYYKNNDSFNHDISLFNRSTIKYPFLSVDTKKIPRKNPILYKTCIVTVIEDSKYIDAVCLNENPNSPWPAGYEHFPAIMEELHKANVWKSKENGGVAGPQDCVDTSSITTTTMSVQRREGSKIYHTADDWFIAENTYKKVNTPPSPTN